jgi:hypothetical protein
MEKYTTEELGFILYNNRSVSGVVSNFLPKINPFKLIKMETMLDIVKEKYDDNNHMVEINKNELKIDEDDIIIYPKDIEQLTDLITKNIGKFSEEESKFLKGRGINRNIIEKYSLLGLSSISDINTLKILGATAHPILSKFIDDGLEYGGIIIPLFKDGILINCAIRKIGFGKDGLSDILEDKISIKTNALKYSLSCPDVFVWGLDDLELNSEIWITEGIFDMMALKELGKSAVSCSSAMWSGIQLYRILEKEPSNIVIVSDNDNVGLRVSLILKEFFIKVGIPTKTIVSKIGKDPSELYFENNKGLEFFKDIDISIEMIDLVKDNSFDFIGYMKNRKF